MIRLPQFSGTITVNLMGQNAKGGKNIAALRDHHRAILENVHRSSGANATYQDGFPTRCHGQFKDDVNAEAQNQIVSQLMQLGVYAHDIFINIPD